MLKIVNDFLIFWQSGEISPNLVTLVTYLQLASLPLLTLFLCFNFLCRYKFYTPFEVYRRISRTKDKLTGAKLVSKFQSRVITLEPKINHYDWMLWAVWPDWAVFWSSWWQICLQKYPKYFMTFWALFKTLQLS